MDYTIALQSMLPKIDTPFEAQGKALQLRQLMNSGQQADYQARQNAQAESDDASYRAALQANPGGGEGLLSALAGSGNYKGLASAQKGDLERKKGLADIGKTEADTQESKIKALNQSFTIHRDQLNTVNDPASAAQWVTAAYKDPILGPAVNGVAPLETALKHIPTDPAEFKKWKLQAGLNSEQYVKQTSADANTRANNATSVTTNAATNATSRANNSATIVAENARSTARLGAENNQVVESDAGPVLVNKRAGTTQTITGPNGQPLTKTKPLTEFQGKSAAFGDRALASDKILNEIGMDYSPSKLSTKASLSNAPLIGGIAGAAANITLTGNEQRVEQAQRDFINATLRQESGAAISPSEFENARKQYFPQPGDGPEVIRQKAANRQLVINGFSRSAGQNVNLGAASSPRKPSAGTVEDGYRFKGGDAKDPKNWEKL